MARGKYEYGSGPYSEAVSLRDSDEDAWRAEGQKQDAAIFVLSLILLRLYLIIFTRAKCLRPADLIFLLKAPTFRKKRGL